MPDTNPLKDARWNGQIVGQGGPADDDLVSFWTGLAMKYANEDRIVFGIMNEPHDCKNFHHFTQCFVYQYLVIG
jgi:aryl-phospho-beta-D-glucosidase BglC (GH1 family)